MSTCAINDCPEPSRSRGWCKRHYEHWRVFGDPLSCGSRIIGDNERRFWAKVDRRGPDDCWPFMGGLIAAGYGQFGVGPIGSRRVLRAHRYAYGLLIGPIPEGEHLDHLCHNADPACGGGSTCPHRRCCNPSHLEPVPSAENSRRTSAAGYARRGEHQRRKTHCPKGHPYDDANTCHSNGRRHCRACGRENQRRYLARKAAQRA